MNRFFSALILVQLTALSVSQLYAGNYGMAGCGLGSQIPAWKNDIGQVLAATTNVATSSQTLGITSGTSNCTNDGVVRSEKAQKLFVHYNYPTLILDFSRGEGERLQALATLMGCPLHSKELGLVTKSQLSQILTSGTKTDSDLILSNVQELVKKDPILSKACNF